MMAYELEILKQILDQLKLINVQLIALNAKQPQLYNFPNLTPLTPDPLPQSSWVVSTPYIDTNTNPNPDFYCGANTVNEGLEPALFANHLPTGIVKKTFYLK